MAVPKLVTATCVPIGNVTGQGVPYLCFLPERSQSGNLLLLWVVQNSGTATISSVTDDQSQTWTQVDLGNGTTGTGSGNTNLLLWCYKMENTAAGVQKITVNFSANNGFTQSAAVEIFNVPASATIGHVWFKEGTVSGTAWDAGTAATPTAGRSIYQVAFQSTGTTYNGGGVSTAGTNYSLELDSIIEGCVAQSWENVTATSHSPTITVNTTSTWITAAIEVVAGTGGADGASFRTKRLQGTNYSVVSATTFPWHLPTDGNLILVDISDGGSAPHITGWTGATFTEHPNSPLSNGATQIQHFHADNTTASRTARNGTVTLSAAGTGGAMWLRDVIGADPSPLDTTTSGTGTQSVAGNLQPLTVSPSAGTRMCSVYLDHESGSETGVVTATDNFLLPYSQQDGTSLNGYALDSGFAAKVISSGTFAPNFTRSATAAGLWAALGASYKAATAGPTVAQTMPAMGRTFSIGAMYV